MSGNPDKLKATADRLGLAVEQVPRSIAIIMDGNGRWAERKSLPRVRGHREGARTAEKIAHFCVEFGIDSLTLYSFSMENWKRPRTEVNGLMHLYAQYLVNIRPDLIEKNVRLVHLGRLEGLPDSVVREMKETMAVTKDNTGMIFALALNYSGRAEIVDAARKIASRCKAGRLALKDIDEQCISDNLYTAGVPDPDLLIRTADEMRVSNFLLWQISYSEFYVTKTLWPDFDKPALEQAMLAYAQRDRRFGAI